MWGFSFSFFSYSIGQFKEQKFNFPFLYDIAKTAVFLEFKSIRKKERFSRFLFARRKKKSQFRHIIFCSMYIYIPVVCPQPVRNCAIRKQIAKSEKQNTLKDLVRSRNTTPCPFVYKHHMPRATFAICTNDSDYQRRNTEFTREFTCRPAIPISTLHTIDRGMFILSVVHFSIWKNQNETGHTYAILFISI